VNAYDLADDYLCMVDDAFFQTIEYADTEGVDAWRDFVRMMCGA
jgi:hypothetical protein